MAAKRDYYEVLGISRDADLDEIKKAYRKLALEYHPDRNPGDTAAEEKFKEATEAYEVLKDPQKRQQYDQFGHQAPPGAGPGFGGFTGFSTVEEALNAFMSAFGGGMGGSFGGGFEDLFGGGMRGGGRRRRTVRRGGNIEVRLPLTLKEIAAGVSKKVKVRRWERCEECSGNGSQPGTEPETCGTCEGAGQVQQVSRSLFGQMVNITTCPTCQGEGTVISEPCSACSGTGRTRVERTLNVKVPAGVAEGNYLTLNGEGNVGLRGGPAGDVIVFIEEKHHPGFDREGDDLYRVQPVSIAVAAQGGSIKIPTLNGTARLKVPAHTQSGKILRLRGEGLPHLNGYGKGDLLVEIVVWTPQKPSGAEKKILDEIARDGLFEPGESDQEKLQKARRRR